MNIGILANEGSWYFRDLARAAIELGHTCSRLDFTRLVASIESEAGDTSRDRVAEWRKPGCPLETSALAITTQQDLPTGRQRVFVPDCDVVLVRTMPPGSLEQVVFRMDLLERLESSGTLVLNSPKSLECAIDKFLTTARLKNAGLPVPETIVCEHEDDALEAFERLGRDVVVKPLFGSEGRGIVRVTDPDLAHRTFRTLMRLNAVLYLQRYIDHGGFDVRILVLNGSVVGGMKRCSPGDFRTNVAREAIAEIHTPTAQEVDFALQAAAVSQTFMAGVDLLYDREHRCYVIEVNAVPGWQAFRRVTGIDVAKRFLKQIELQR